MINALWSALYSRLAAGTALTSSLALLKGGTTTAICHAQAPDGQAFPYVIYSWQGGGYQHNTPSVDVNGVLYIRAYSRVSQSQAGSISEAVFNLLDRQPLTVTGWANIGLFAESPHLQFNETDASGLMTYSSGDEFRAWLDKS